MKKKEKGYVLAVVMLFSLLLAMVLVTTFAICYRYQRAAKRNLEELRQEVFKPAETATPENGGETGGTETPERSSEPSEPAANASGAANFADANAIATANAQSDITVESHDNNGNLPKNNDFNAQPTANASDIARCLYLPQNCGERQG